MSALPIVVGWAADAVAGDPARFHPVAGFGRVAQAVERRMWRDARAAGVAYVALLVGVPAALTWSIDRRVHSRPLRVLLRAAVTWAVVAGRSLQREATAIGADLDRGDVAAARARLPALVGRDPSRLDSADISRAVVESVAENTGDAVVAPLLWAAVAGPAGAVAYRCANTLDAMVGHHSERYERFGWGAARLDDLLNCVPSRVGAAIACAAAPIVGGSSRTARATRRRDGAKHPSPNAGQLEAAFAGALGVRLGGVNTYGDRTELRGPLGDGCPPAARDIARATRLADAVGAGSCVLAVGLAAGVQR